MFVVLATGTKQWIAEKEKVGFIGLGNMGGGMAKNLCEKGHDVIAYDVCQDAVCIPLRKGLIECILTFYCSRKTALITDPASPPANV